MKHTWSSQGDVKMNNSEETEEFFKKEFTEAVDRRQIISMRKGKRFRSAFTTDQVIYLENEFKKFPYIGTAQRKEVANVLNIDERAVKIWFQNRRMKEKKDMGKDQESDDQSARKNCAFNNNNFINNIITVPAAVMSDPCYSLSQLTIPTNNMVNVNMTTDIITPDTGGTVTESVKLNYYNDISPVRDCDLPKMSYANYTPPPIACNSKQNFRSSAEFSIDLCKKYKNGSGTDSNKVNNNRTTPTSKKIDNASKFVQTTPQQVYHQEGFPKIEPQSLPEDLSCKPNVVKQEPSPPKSESNGQGYIPLYLNYPQPILSAGNMLWKPVNVVPVMSSGVSAVNISSNQSGTLSVSQDANLPKKCKCECHSKAPAAPVPDSNVNPPPQYVITALPFQNYPKFT